MAEKIQQFIRKPKEFLGGAIHALKGPDVESLVEDFTSEMTVVAEGLCDDQMRLRQAVDDISAQQTLLEQQTSDARQEIYGKLDQFQKDANTKLSDMQKRLQALETKQSKLGKKNGTITQLTWLVGIAAGAWVLVTLLNLLK